MQIKASQPMTALPLAAGLNYEVAHVLSTLKNALVELDLHDFVGGHHYGMQVKSP